jgi:hypothetical protein
MISHLLCPDILLLPEASLSPRCKLELQATFSSDHFKGMSKNILALKILFLMKALDIRLEF